MQTLSRSAFAAMRAHRAFNDALLCGYMRLLSSNVAKLRLEDLETRLVMRLLQSAWPTGAGLPSVRLSQAELGMMVGATRQSVNKLLREFQEEGLVELAYGRVLVRTAGRCRGASRAGANCRLLDSAAGRGRCRMVIRKITSGAGSALNASGRKKSKVACSTQTSRSRE